MDLHAATVLPSLLLTASGGDLCQDGWHTWGGMGRAGMCGQLDVQRRTPRGTTQGAQGRPGQLLGRRSGEERGLAGSPPVLCEVVGTGRRLSFFAEELW